MSKVRSPGNRIILHLDDVHRPSKAAPPSIISSLVLLSGRVTNFLHDQFLPYRLQIYQLQSFRHPLLHNTSIWHQPKFLLTLEVPLELGREPQSSGGQQQWWYCIEWKCKRAKVQTPLLAFWSHIVAGQTVVDTLSSATSQCNISAENN